MPIEYLFVYGTLRKCTVTSLPDVIACQCEYIAEGVLQGKLYEVRGYPGAIESDLPNDHVYGDIYRINNNGWLLPLLDEYEECTALLFPEPQEYIRKQLPVSLAGGGSMAAWVYIFNRPVASLSPIPSGDYLQYLKFAP